MLQAKYFSGNYKRAEMISCDCSLKLQIMLVSEIFLVRDQWGKKSFGLPTWNLIINGYFGRFVRFCIKIFRSRKIAPNAKTKHDES